MCRRTQIIALACSGLLYSTAVAQDRAALEALLGRARAEQEALRRRSAQALEQARQRMSTGRSGAVLVALPEELADRNVGQIARGVDSVLRALAPIPESAVASIALVAVFGDLRIISPGIEGRREVEVGVPGGGSWPSSALVANAADAAIRSLLLRDDAWSAWTQRSLEYQWTHRNSRIALNDLLVSPTAAGRQCVAGEAAGCATWLGIDRVDDPVNRFTGGDVRRLLGVGGYVRTTGQRDPRDDCVSGDDGACLDWQRSQSPRTGEPTPVWDARIHPGTAGGARSLLHFVRVRDDPTALVSLLADTTGTVGERLERATGVSAVVLAAEWRAWLFASADRAPVHAGLSEALSAVLGIGLMLVVATRGGRWSA